MSTILSCPFCGKQPIIECKKVGMRDEPYYLYTLYCPDHHAHMSVTLSDKEERTAQEKEHNLFKVEDAMSKKHYWDIALPKLVTKWNTRL